MPKSLTTNFAKFCLAGCSPLAMAIPLAAQAQTGPDNQAQQEQATAASSVTNEIIVTATKREQALSDIGITVAAIEGDALDTQRIATVADIAKITPGLTFAPTPSSTPVYTLRGVGFFESSLAAYPDVSLYIDQVPLPLPIMSALTAFDLQRVEVLKGPQGTLFGNNATGGAINFIAAKPTLDFEAGAEFSFGRFNTMEYKGYVSGPLTDTLQARLAFRGVNGDDWQKSFTRLDGGVPAEYLAVGVPDTTLLKQDTLGKQDNIAGRLLLDWQPTPDLKFELNVNGWRDQSDPLAPQIIAHAPKYPSVQDSLPDYPILNYPLAPQNARAADWSPRLRPYQDNTFWQTSLRSDYDFGDLTLTSITGYSRLRFLGAQEGGGTALIDLDLGQERGKARSFTQELRLSNGGTNSFRWVVGANYEHTKVDQTTGFYYSDTTSTVVNGIGINGYITNQVMKNYAGFGNIEFDVADNVTLKAGIRQTKAKRTVDAFNGDLGEFPVTPYDTRPDGSPILTTQQFFNAVYGAVFGGQVATIPPGGNIVLDTRLNPDGTPVNPDTYLTTIPFSGKLDENSTSWSVGVDFKATDDLLLYANISKGFKAGSFPHLSGAIYTAYEAVVQEELLDYEVGFKAQLFDRRISINGAAFYYDYKNKQLRAKYVDPIFLSLDKLVNVPKSRIKGFELDISGRPADGLTLSASATYLDAKVVDYVGSIGYEPDPNLPGFVRSVDVSFKGARLPFAPELQYSLRGDYDTAISESLNGFVGVGVSGQTKTIGILSVLPEQKDLYKINARALVDGNIGIRAGDDSWKVTLWGKNIFNKYYWTNTIEAYDTVVRYAGRPAEYGISVGVKF